MHQWSSTDLRHAPGRVLDGLAHTLRGPLHNLRGWTTLLESGRLPEGQIAHAHTVIARQVLLLARLADEVERLAEQMGEDGAVEAPPAGPADDEGVGDEVRAPGDLSGRAVLVVHPDADELAGMTRVLAAAGATVHATRWPEAALSILRQRRPSALLVALRMPGIDGSTLVRQIRNWPAADGGDVPAAALGSLPDADAAVHFEGSGFQARLDPSPSSEALLATVVRLVG